jgi:ribosomal protein S28E/S33
MNNQTDIIIGEVYEVICRCGKAGECTYAKVKILTGPDAGRFLRRVIRGLVFPGDLIELVDTKHEHPLIKQEKR